MVTQAAHHRLFDLMKIHQTERWKPFRDQPMIIGNPPRFMKNILLAILSLVSAVAVTAADQSLSGHWTLTSDIGGKESTTDMTLRQDGETLSGTVKTPEGKDLDLKGQVSGKNISWQFISQYQGTALTLVHTGTIGADGAISGSVEVQPLGFDGTFEAKRSDNKRKAR